MKFTEGMWRVKEGFDINWMGHVERLQVNNDQVDLLLTKTQRGRGDKLNTGTISAVVRSPLEGITAVNLTHWAGEHLVGPNFPLNEQPASVQIQHSTEKELKFSSGPLDLSINTAPNSLSFDYSSESRRLTGHSFRSIAFVTSSDTPVYNAADGLYAQRDNYILLELDLSVDEKIYGLGERFGPFVKNGQAVDMWNEDGGTSSELTYKNIPIYLSSRGYGVFVNNPGKVMFEVQSERTTRVNIAIKGESLEYMIVAGPTLKDVLNRYTALTGRPGVPPAWSYGLWLTTSFTTSYDEDTVLSFLDGFKTRDIPLTVFHFDAFWMKSYQWCDFTFDADYFPDAAGYISRLKSRGMKLCVWINPYISQSSPLFLEGKKNGYFLMRANTLRPTVWQWDEWQPGMAVVDFTNPAAADWYASQIKKLISLGIDSFKTDFGERIPFSPRQVKYHDPNCDPIRMHNFYPYLYNKCVYEAIQSAQKTQSLQPPCLFARSATAGCQQFPVHWGGDCESTFEAMAETLRGGLSFGLCGFAFWAHDIGGFEGKPDPTLYKRWVQFGLLSTHSRLHGSSSYRVPWIYGDEFPGEDEQCSRVLEQCVKRKLGLMPYLLQCAMEAHTKGTPVMRAMLLEFPHDWNVWTLDTQYMFGPDLLVAPVFDPSGEVRFYVPSNPVAGDKRLWRDWFDHSKTYEAGKWYIERRGFDSLPLLVRPGAAVPVNWQIKDPEQSVLDGLEVLCNGLVEETSMNIIDTKDVSKVAVTFTIGKDLKVTGLDVKVVDLTKK